MTGLRLSSGFKLADCNLQFPNRILQFASLLFVFVNPNLKVLKKKVTPTHTFSVTKNCDLQSLVNQNKLFAIVSVKLQSADLKPDTTQHSGLSHGHFVNKMAEHYLQRLEAFWKTEELLPCPETHNIFS